MSWPGCPVRVKHEPGVEGCSCAAEAEADAANQRFIEISDSAPLDGSGESLDEWSQRVTAANLARCEAHVRAQEAAGKPPGHWADLVRELRGEPRVGGEEQAEQGTNLVDPAQRALERLQGLFAAAPEDRDAYMSEFLHDPDALYGLTRRGLLSGEIEDLMRKLGKTGRGNLMRAARPIGKEVAADQRRERQTSRTKKAESDEEEQARNKVRHAISYENEDGKVIVMTTLHTACIVLKMDPRWRGKVRRNELTDTTMLGSAQLRPEDVLSIAEWMEIDYGAEWPVDKVRNAIQLVGDGDRYHPIREYLSGLPKWDDTPRLDRLLVDYFGVDARKDPKEHVSKRDPDGLFAAYGRCLLIGMVARAIKPGTKLDNVLTLQGPMGFFKSSGLKALVYDEAWFADDKLPMEDPKRLGMALRGLWLIEFADFATVKRADRDTVKAFLTQCEDKYIPMHGREPIRQPRSVVFVATANDESFLVEPGRRWWVAPVKHQVDVDAIRRDRDQLFAEALHRYLAKESHWLSDKLESKQAEDVKQYALRSPTQDTLEEWWSGQSRAAGQRFSLFELWDEVMPSRNAGVAPMPPTMTEQKAFAGVLRDAGWTNKKGRNDKGNRWYPPADAAKPATDKEAAW